MARAVKIVIDDKRLKTKLSRIRRNVDKGAQKEVRYLANVGRDFAKGIAPKETGSLANLIQVKEVTRMGGFQAEIISKNPKSNRKYPGRGKYKDFSLPLWLKETGGIFRSPNPFGKVGTRHIKSGDPGYMDTTKEFLKRFKKELGKRFFKNLDK
jgi:hypothetical protein